MQTRGIKPATFWLQDAGSTSEPRSPIATLFSSGNSSLQPGLLDLSSFLKYGKVCIPAHSKWSAGWLSRSTVVNIQVNSFQGRGATWRPLLHQVQKDSVQHLKDQAGQAVEPET